MHPSGERHLFLCRIPQRIVRFGILKLLLCIQDRPAIPAVLGERSRRPGLHCVNRVIEGIKPHEVHREFAAYDHLLQKCLLCLCRRGGTLHRERNRVRTDVAEMKVSR